jgi:superfamily II DNA or RNA helicase
MQEIKVIEREALFLKKSSISNTTAEKIIKNYTFYFFEDSACKSCEWYEDRLASETKLSSACETCAGFKGGVALAKEVKIGKNQYLSIPGGTKNNLEKLVGTNISYVSKHVDHKFKKPIKFTGTLRDFQEEAVQSIIKKKYGVVKLQPRSGKTVLSVAAVCRIGMRTIILAAQREWLEGFYETFCGSPTQKALTNATKNQVGFSKTLEDFEKYDVSLCTYQTFRSEKGKKLLAKLRDYFTVNIVDEVHMSPATTFARVLASLNVKMRIGLSGTPSRKDNRWVIADALLGPIIYTSKVERLVPKVQLVRTQYRKNYKGRVLWTTMVSSLENNKNRLKLIAKWALKDAKDGHLVLIPLAQIKPIKALCLEINRLASKRVAHPFYGGLKKEVRKKLVEDARNYKARIIVGNTKLLSTGINIPRASAIYSATLSSNIENCEQRVSRILTPWENKPPPLLRIFLDSMNVAQRCLANEWYQCIKPKFKPVIAAKDEAILKSYLSEKQKEVPPWEL